MTPPPALLPGLALALWAPFVAHGRASADERAIGDALAVRGEDGCVTREALAPLVESWLGRGSLAPELAVEVDVAGRVGSFRVLRSGEAIGARGFDRLPAECSDRRAALALAIALALDAAVLDALGPTTPVAPEPPGGPEAVPPSSRIRVSIEAEAMLTLEVVAGPAMAGAAAVALVLPEGVRVRAGMLATQEVGIGFGHGAAAATLVAGRLDACLDGDVGAGVRLGGCAGGLGGALLAQGRGFSEDRAADLPWAAAALRAELRWLPWEMLALSVAVDGLFALVRPRLDVGDGRGGVLEERTVSPAGLGIVLGAAVVLG